MVGGSTMRCRSCDYYSEPHVVWAASCEGATVIVWEQRDPREMWVELHVGETVVRLSSNAAWFIASELRAAAQRSEI